MKVSPDDHRPTDMNQQFHTFQENLSGLFQLCKDSVQIFQGSLTLVGHPVLNEVKHSFKLAVNITNKYHVIYP